jgi:hypothetical protein
LNTDAHDAQDEIILNFLPINVQSPETQLAKHARLTVLNPMKRISHMRVKSFAEETDPACGMADGVPPIASLKLNTHSTKTKKASIPMQSVKASAVCLNPAGAYPQAGHSPSSGSA